MRLGRELPWLCKVETRRLLWLLGLTFAIIITFQYIELPYAISSLFSSSKIPFSRNTTTSHVKDPNFAPAMSPSFPPQSQTNPEQDDEETDVDQIVDSSGNATSPEISPIAQDTAKSPSPFPGLNPSPVKNMTSKSPSPSPVLNPSLIKENATSPVPSTADSPAGLPGLNPSLVKENATSPAPSVESPAALPGLNSSLVKENATSPVPGVGSPVALPGLSPSQVKGKAIAPVASVESPVSLPGLNATSSVKDNVTVPAARPNVGNGSSEVRFVPNIGEIAKKRGFGVMSIKEMSKELRRSRISHEHQAKKPKWVTKPDLELLQAKYEILNAPIDDKDPAFYSPLYRNVSVFKRSYELMEKMLKVYVYKEGNKPVMHNPILNGIYASEGWFMKLIESNNNKFVTKDAAKAHLFYLPFSSRMLEVSLYVQDSHSHRNLIQYLKEYIDYIAGKYPYWNRTSGADHFLAACHDWAPSETRKYMAKTIRSLCNSDVKEGFIFGKDTALPETFVKDFKKPLSNIGGKSASQRPILAFFAGKPEHGYLRPILLSYWGNNKDPDMKIFGRLPRTKGNKNYLTFMKTSKYCICAKGYEVNSPRVVEAIFYECVPVIISDNFVPPFFEILNWESFAIFVPEKDIPNLKNILMAISDRKYREMQRRVKKVQKHFLWHVKPEKYDMFHMILHSVWFNRVFQVAV